MANKKISDFAPATPVNTDKYLIEQADGSYRSVSGALIATVAYVDAKASAATKLYMFLNANP